MLTKHALQLYLEPLRGLSLLFASPCTEIKNRFKTEKRTRALIRRDSISLPLIRNENENNHWLIVVNILDSRLNDINLCLHIACHPDITMKNKIINSIKVVEACKRDYKKRQAQYRVSYPIFILPL